MAVGWRCRLCTNQAIEGSPYCADHAGIKQTSRPPRPYGGRGSPKGQAFGPTASKEWRALSRAILKRSPWCVRCRSMERWTGAAVADHVIPARMLHEKDPALVFDEAWIQPLCRPCHATKTLHERRGTAYDYREAPVKCWLIRR